MRIKLNHLLAKALAQLQNDGHLPRDLAIHPSVEYARNSAHGDFTSSLALNIAQKVQGDALAIANLLISALPADENIAKVVAAGSGFINFHLTEQAFYPVINAILQHREKYGHTDIGTGRRVLIEFVSANPTGPLHVGHGRGAAFGATVADLLEAMGFQVHREYYVNDAGRQMHILALSVWLRYLAIDTEVNHFPASGYHGDYIIEIARTLRVEYGATFCRSLELLYRELPADAKDHGDPEFYVDAMVERARSLLGANDYRIIFTAAQEAVLADIHEDLSAFDVNFQEWFRESNLISNGDVARGIEVLCANGHAYTEDGALWFRATAFGDEKDRVLVRSNGQTTYFASDVGYHLNKYNRGFDRIIDILGADHHGYAPRIRGFLQALGLDTNKFEVLLVQFAILYRGQQKISMSTRAGEFVTLRTLRTEVGKDAARFFYLLRKNDQHLDFDLELAKEQSTANPVYYIQYAHARICSVMRQLAERRLDFVQSLGLKNLGRLQAPQEQQIIRCLGRYADVLREAALRGEPHNLAHYLRELANNLHIYYNACQFLVDDAKLRNARLCLIQVVKQVLANGLTLLGVSTPEAM